MKRGQTHFPAEDADRSPSSQRERGLTTMTLRGLTTIRKLPDFRPGAITLLIRPNGAGKPNLLPFFRFLPWALAPPGQLQKHVAKLSGASALPHCGPEKTREIEAHLELVTDAGVNEYRFRPACASGDTLIYTGEQYRFSRYGLSESAKWTSPGAGHKESELNQHAESGLRTAQAILSPTRKMVLHQFHNTSETARIRRKWHVEESRRLKEDAANLAPFLLRLQTDVHPCRPATRSG